MQNICLTSTRSSLLATPLKPSPVEPPDRRYAMKDLYQVIKTIRLSERATILGERNNEYVFVVDPKANKIEIKQAVEKLFGKTVLDVRTMNYAGKKKRERRADYGRTNHWKKAIVKLKAGETIELV